MTRHRGLKLFLLLLQCLFFSLHQQTYDPTQGIETEDGPEVKCRLNHIYQQTYDPTQGIETYNLHYSDHKN